MSKGNSEELDRLREEMDVWREIMKSKPDGVCAFSLGRPCLLHCIVFVCLAYPPTVLIVAHSPVWSI